MARLPVNKGKVFLDFKLQRFDEGLRDAETDEETAPPHWRMVDPNGTVYCYGYLPSFDGMVALMRLAKLGARHATRDELVEEGIIIAPKSKVQVASGDDMAARIDRILDGGTNQHGV